MASNINTTDIDIEFPVPGQDNDSQGFRDNFNVINTNFSEAKTEIEDLQTNAVRKDADTTFLDNEQSNPVTLIRPNLKAHSEQYFTPENGVLTPGAEPVVDVSNGGYQVYTLGGGAATFSFDGWPASGYYGKVRLHLTATADSSIAFDNGEDIKFDSFSSDGFWASSNINTGEIHIIDFWSYQGGTTVYAQYLGAFSS
jgi:hypothetical protein